MRVLLERAKEIARYYRMPVGAWQESLGLSNSHFYNLNNISKKVANSIEDNYPDINIDWLITGKGSMLKSKAGEDELKGYIVPLVPVVAHGGTPDELEVQVKESECEKIVSPVKNVNIAITVCGDSMSPEYPNGSIVLMQKINERSFIEWGSTYVLDTTNGVVIKNVFMDKNNEGNIICRSVNPNFTDFTISRDDIRGWYKVRLCMIMK